MAEQLVFNLLTNDRASAGFAAAGRSASAASDDVLKLGIRLDEIGRKSADARVGLTGNKEATAQLDAFDLKLLATGRRVVDPKITLDGAAKAAAEIAALDVALDKLGKKSATPSDGGIGGIGRLVTPFGGVGGAGGGGVGGGGALATIGAGLTTPAGAAAALAALPFLAQAAAGTITFGLGGALAGIGVYAEKGVRSVQYQFAQLWSGKQGIQSTLANISPAFGQALTTILSAARTFVPQFIRDFGPALDAIAGPLKAFGTELAGTLASPQIATSLKETGKAFGSILSALTPAIPGIATAVSDGFTNIARAVAKNPKAFADFISGIAHVIAAALDVIAWLTQVAAYIEMHFIPAFHGAQSDLLNWTLNVAAFFVKWGHDIEHEFDSVRTAVTGTVARLIADVVNFFAGLPHRTLNALSGWGNDLNQFGHQAINLLWEGLKAGATSIVDWIGGFAKGIVNIFKKIWGWFSPSSVMYEGGKSLMEGLAKGIEDHAHLAQAAAAKAAGKGTSGAFTGAYGPGVAQWQPDVLRALSMEGLPASLAGQVLYQMMTESGGNPNAINLTDSNAAAGDPSRGLLQTIMSTFQSYHWPGTSWDIYDPLANIAAAINYARHRYGPSLMSGGQGLGSGHGYDQGGLLPPGLSLAWNATGRAEVVAPGGMGRVEALLDELCNLVAANNDLTAAAPARTGAGLGAALAGGARAATYKALYG